MNIQSINVSAEKSKYYVSFTKLKYVYSEAELPNHSYVKVTIDTSGRHLRRHWYRADGRMTTREELQYDAEGKLSRIEVFDEDGTRKGFTIYKYPEQGRTVMHRFDSQSKPTEVLDEHRNKRGFVLKRHHQQIEEHGAELKTVMKIEYSYPEPGLRKGDYFDEEGKLTHTIIDHYNSNGDHVASEKFDPEGEMYFHSEYVYDAGGRILERIDTDAGGAVIARVNYQK